LISHNNGYQAYQKNKYETASPHRLITMLYEGAIRFMSRAATSLDATDIANGNAAITRAQDILYELIACLNFDEGKDIAHNLNNLYRYVIDLTVQANIKKESAPLREAINIITEIKASWEQIGREVSMTNG